MNDSILFLASSMVLAFALSMDAFSIALTDGMCQTDIDHKEAGFIASTYGFFQMAMPLIGWFGVSRLAQVFEGLSSIFPLISFVLLTYIGISMIRESSKSQEDQEKKEGQCDLRILTFSTIIFQALATSLDALSVGFTIGHLQINQAFLICTIIGILTFVNSFIGIQLGKKIGNKLASRAYTIGGLILIFIGIRLLISSLI